MVVNDKETYILTDSLTRVQNASLALQTRVEKVMLALQIPGFREAVFSPHSKKHTRYGVHALYEISTRSDAIDIKRSSPGAPSTLKSMLTELAWTPQWIAKRQNPELNALKTGELIMCWSPNPRSNVGYVALLEPTALSQGQSIQIFLVNGIGEPMLKSLGEKPFIPLSELQTRVLELSQNGFEEGTTIWSTSVGPLIVAYHHIGETPLTAVGMTPQSTALAAVKQLRLKSAGLGIAILLLVIGFTLILLHQLTLGLKQMVQATRKVSEGIFNLRVDTRNMGSDEVGTLANSFNKMAKRIDLLMRETAQKAVVEKEVETAQVVQYNFFPEKTFEHPNARIGIDAHSTPQNGQNWWTYGKYNDELIIVQCEGTAHGLSAALLTASVHTAFSGFMETTKLLSAPSANLKLLHHYLNAAVWSAGQGKDTMSAFLIAFNTFTGEGRCISAGHPPALLHRIDRKEARDDYSLQFSLLTTQIDAPLGASKTVSSEPTSFSLRPADQIVLMNDGWRRYFSDGSLIRMLAQELGGNSEHPEKVSEKLLKSAEKDLSSRSIKTPEDLALMIFSIPKRADFKPQGAHYAA